MFDTNVLNFPFLDTTTEDPQTTAEIIPETSRPSSTEIAALPSIAGTQQPDSEFETEEKFVLSVSFFIFMRKTKKFSDGDVANSTTRRIFRHSDDIARFLHCLLLPEKRKEKSEL